MVQLSTLDWRLLRSNDFYLQVVPFSTRCPRLALKCLAPGGRTVQEILVPESQHPLVFTTEWLHSVNKERGHRREGMKRMKDKTPKNLILVAIRNVVSIVLINFILSSLHSWRWTRYLPGQYV